MPGGSPWTARRSPCPRPQRRRGGCGGVGQRGGGGRSWPFTAAALTPTGPNACGAREGVPGAPPASRRGGGRGDGGDEVWGARRSEDPRGLQVPTRVEDSKFGGYGAARGNASVPASLALAASCLRVHLRVPLREKRGQRRVTRSVPPARPPARGAGGLAVTSGQQPFGAPLCGFALSRHGLAAQLATVTALAEDASGPRAGWGAGFLCISFTTPRSWCLFPLCLRNQGVKSRAPQLWSYGKKERPTF